MHRIPFALAGLSLLAGAASAQAPERPMTFDDIMSLRSLGAVEIAPDGHAVVFSVSAWDRAGGTAGSAPVSRSHLWVVPAAGGPPRQITFGERGEGRPQWSPDGRTIAFAAARSESGSDERARAQIWLLPIEAGGEAQQLTHAQNGVSGYAWSPDGRRIAYVTTDSASGAEEAKRRRHDDAEVYESDSRRAHVWVIDVATREATEVAHGDFTLSGLAVPTEPSWSPDGTRIAFNAPTSSLLRELRGAIYIVTVATKQVERVAPAFRSPAGGLGRPVWSPDGKTIAFVNFPQSDKLQADSIPYPRLVNGDLVLYDVATKRVTTIRHPTFDYTLDDIAWAPDGTSLLITAGDRVYQSLFRYDVASGAFSRITSGMMLRSFSVSKDGAHVAFSMETPTSPSDLYVSDLGFRSPRRLTTLNPQVAGFALGRTEVITWKSSDGLPIEGILLEPVGSRPGERHPLLVVVHGGPTGAHQNGFKATTSTPGQVWAGRGWAVLYPNPRGSTGYGEKFMNANILDLGGGDYRDIMAGVDDLIRRGIADSTKLAVQGWSYGGQMTAWIVTQTSRFKAASMGAGIANEISMYGTSEIPGYEGLFLGGMLSEKTYRIYRAHSALTFADHVTTPLLIQHGAADPRVPPGQSMEFYRALKDRGRTVQLVLYPREQHGFGEYYHLLDRMERDYDWITKYTLGATPERTTMR
jgi:dipeptidyl aminopeptidase/acylaminoacyl peptidase